MGNNGLLFKNIFALTKMEVDEFNRKLNNKKIEKNLQECILYAIVFLILLCIYRNTLEKKTKVKEIIINL